MNSTEELSSHREPSQYPYYPTKKTAYFEYDFTDDRPTKKEKKWTFGNLFRRKKKNNDSSSDDEAKKTNDKRKKKERKKPVTFDHVVITQPKVGTAVGYSASNNNHNNGYPEHVLSDTSETVLRYANRVPINNNGPRIEHYTHHWDPNLKSQQGYNLGVDSVCRRSRRELTKVRAEARRTSLNRNSSSDDDSQKSNSSHRFRSDESLSKGFICSKRTRSARTERYLKRHSKDGENPNNYLRVSKSDAESSFLRLSDESAQSPSVSPSQFKVSYSSISSQSPSILGLSTIPPSHVNHSRFRVSNSTSNPSYKPPLSMNEYNTARSNSSQSNNGKTFNNQRSISFDANIHRPQEDPQVIHARLELGKPRARNFTLVDGNQLRQYCTVIQPPAPPPRDPKRLISNQSLDTFNGATIIENNSSQVRNFQDKQVRNLNSSYLPSNFKSSSEDHIPRGSQISLAERPASATPAPRNKVNMNIDSRARSENYQYLTDKQPRSRKPIFIQNGLTKSFSQREVKDKKESLSNKESSAFLDQLKARKSNRSLRESPQIFTAETKVQTQIFLPSVLSNNTNNNYPSENNNEETIPSRTQQVENNLEDVNQNQEGTEPVQRKSSNLEEALKELEAIYDSLKLGDENLLEMAEQREKDLATQNLLERKNHYPFWSSPRGTLSDSGFNYEPYDSIDASKRKRYLRESLKTDDMAFRKINREDRATTITDPQNVAANISYLLTSPVYAGNQTKVEDKSDPNEPDITLDDVVYRNITQSNKLKVPEHPPPFGIPLRPALASNSDYLHAIPDTEIPKPSRIPDLVKDDLAFRNLRKDNNKAPALPPVSAEDLKNNNDNTNKCFPTDSNRVELSDYKKKRAVRSKSANIGSLISREVIERASRRNARDKNNESDYKTLGDIADAMDIARQVLKEKENKITEQRQASISDTDTNNHLKYVRYPLPRRKTIGATNEPYTFDVGEKPSTNMSADIKIDSRSTKEGTPDPVSAFEDGKFGALFRTSSFEDALTALAIEAKEASDKFTKDLAAFDPKKTVSTQQETTTAEDLQEEPVNLCRKLLNAVLGSTEHIACHENYSEEKDEPEMMESVANIVLSSNDPGKLSPVVVLKGEENVESSLPIDPNLISAETAKVEELLKSFETEKNEEEPDYCNLVEEEVEEGLKGKSPGETCVDVVQCLNASRAISECAFSKATICSDSDGDSSGFFSSQASQQLLSEHVCSFSSESLSNNSKCPKLRQVSLCDDGLIDEDLEDNIFATPNSADHSDLENVGASCDNLSETVEIDSNDRSLGELKLEPESSCKERTDNPFKNLDTARSPSDRCSFSKISECDRFRPSSSSHDVSGSLNDNLHKCSNSTKKLEPSENLKSPKLVLETSKLNVVGSNLSDFSRDFDNTRALDRFRATRHIPDNFKSSGAWHNNPATLAIACCYGIACSHQLASLDLFTLMGIIFAILTFIAALFV